MTAMTIVLLIVILLIFSEYRAKSKYVNQLEDAIDIANSATGFLFRFNSIGFIYNATTDGRHPVDFEEVSEFIGKVVNEGRYHQAFTDIEAVNALRKYQKLGLMDNDKVENLVEKKATNPPADLLQWSKVLEK